MPGPTPDLQRLQPAPSSTSLRAAPSPAPSAAPDAAGTLGGTSRDPRLVGPSRPSSSSATASSPETTTGDLRLESLRARPDMSLDSGRGLQPLQPQHTAFGDALTFARDATGAPDLQHYPRPHPPFLASAGHTTRRSSPPVVQSHPLPFLRRKPIQLRRARSRKELAPFFSPACGARSTLKPSTSPPRPVMRRVILRWARGRR